MGNIQHMLFRVIKLKFIDFNVLWQTSTYAFQSNYTEVISFEHTHTTCNYGSLRNSYDYFPRS